MDVSKRDIGELIDLLITASLRCWHAQDSIMDESLSNEKRLEAAITAQKSNARRSALMRAITEYIDGEDTGFNKSYVK
jgi:hypothetical protein